MLNGGVEPRSNRTIIPPPLFDLLTASYMIVSGTPTNRRRLSLSGYSSGWARESVQGHDVSTLLCVLTQYALLTFHDVSESATAEACRAS